MEDEGEYSLSEGSGNNEDEEDSKSDRLIDKKEKNNSFRYFNEQETHKEVKQEKPRSSFSIFSDAGTKETD